jgi:hypothetical protein
MRAVKLALWIFCGLVLFRFAGAQEPEPEPGPELFVGEINYSSLRWGKRTAIFEVTNNTDELKYITVETEVHFSGLYLNPNRRMRSHYVLKPFEAQIFRPAVYIPGNFGTAKIKISLYDVVDTLDAILPGQKFFEQPFTIRYHAPDEIFSYANEKIDLPPMVERHPDFDNEFARILPELLNEGKSVEEIATMAMADTSFVQEAVENMIRKGYVREEDKSYILTFPFISVDEAEEAKKLAVALSDTLAKMIENNMALYGNILDSLVSVGAVDKDSNAFFDGGVVLYRPYPVISALLLWYHLGQKFITRSAPLWIYDGTDPCNAHIPYYMYAVRGGATFNGTQFYALIPGFSTFQILFGDEIPVIDCGEYFILKAKLKQQVSWNFTEEFYPESFMLDTLVVKPMLIALGAGADSLLIETYFRLRDIAVKYGHKKLLYGERYWFWNLTATRTLKKLVDKGVIIRRGKGQFTFNSFPQ